MSDEKFTFTKSTMEKYDIRWGRGEWAIFSIDNKNGIMQCLSCYGNYGYAWPAHGRNTFKDFLLELEKDWQYLLCKVSDEVFDLDASIKYWKKWIIEKRREGSCTKEDARESFDAVDKLETNSAGYCAAKLE